MDKDGAQFSQGLDGCCQDGAELLKKPNGATKGLLDAFGRQHPLQDCSPVFETLLTFPVVRMEEEK